MARSGWLFAKKTRVSVGRSPLCMPPFAAPEAPCEIDSLPTEQHPISRGLRTGHVVGVLAALMRHEKLENEADLARGSGWLQTNRAICEDLTVRLRP